MKNPSFYAGIFVSILFLFLMSLTLGGHSEDHGDGAHGHDTHETHGEHAEEAHH